MNLADLISKFFASFGTELIPYILIIPQIQVVESVIGFFRGEEFRFPYFVVDTVPFMLEREEVPWYLHPHLHLTHKIRRAFPLALPDHSPFLYFRIRRYILWSFNLRKWDSMGDRLASMIQICPCWSTPISSP